MPKGQNNRKLSDAQRDEIVQRYTTPLPDGTWVGVTTLARDYGVTHNAIDQLLVRRGVQRRSVKEAHAHGKRCKPITRHPQGEPRPCRCGCGELTEWNRAKLRWRWYLPGHNGAQPFKNREWLYEQYVTQRQTVEQVAERCETTKEVILGALRKFDIPRRGNSDAQLGRQAGENNPAWKGGTTPERQRLYRAGHWQELVKQIYERDGYTCQRCGAPKTARRGLHAHHLAPWADAPALRFDHANLITLCRTCHEWVHSTANIEREFLA